MSDHILVGIDFDRTYRRTFEHTYLVQLRQFFLFRTCSIGTFHVQSVITLNALTASYSDKGSRHGGFPEGD